MIPNALEQVSKLSESTYLAVQCIFLKVQDQPSYELHQVTHHHLINLQI
jgi:hypothetical protein